jgi:hypothetical protein
MQNEHRTDPHKEAAKKPYHPPRIRFEKVLEVSALSCGKVNTTQELCHNNTKVS